MFIQSHLRFGVAIKPVLTDEFQCKSCFTPLLSLGSRTSFCSVYVTSDSCCCLYFTPLLSLGSRTLFCWVYITSDSCCCLYCCNSLRIFKTTKSFFAEFEVFTSVVIQGSILWNITVYSPLKLKRHFRRTFRLHLQGRKIKQARNQGSTCNLNHLGFLFDLYFEPENGGNMFF
jgi:hypothetical protein